MSKKITSVVFVLDKSASMAAVRDATISGFNEYINTLKKDKNEYTFSLTLFDTEVEKVYDNVDLKKVKDLDQKSYVPSGMTALYDAACMALTVIEKNLKKTDKTLFVVMTDGEENSSKEHTEKNFADKVKELEGKNFTFIFLGANQDSWATAQKFGANMGNVANFAATARGVGSTMSVMAHNTATFASTKGSSTKQFFSDEDKDLLVKE